MDIYKYAFLDKKYCSQWSNLNCGLLEFQSLERDLDLLENILLNRISLTSYFEFQVLALFLSRIKAVLFTLGIFRVF